MVLVAGCSAGTPGTARSPDPTMPTHAAPAGSHERVPYVLFGEHHESDVPRVVLLDAGEAPRRPLRWQRDEYEARLEVILSRTFETETEQDIGDLVLQGAHQHHEVSLSLRSLRQPLEDRENLSLAFQIESARVVAASDRDHALAQVEGLEGELLWLALTPRGQVLGVATRRAFTPALHLVGQALADVVATPLPAEDVGVGARWSVRRIVGLVGVAAVEEAVYELVEDDRGIVRVTVALHRLPLRDDGGSIAHGDVDRSRGALDAIGTTALSDLDRTIDPSARGRLDAMFAVQAPTFGAYERGLVLETDGQFQPASGGAPIPGRMRETTRVQVMHRKLAAHVGAARAQPAP